MRRPAGDAVASRLTRPPLQGPVAKLSAALGELGMAVLLVLFVPVAMVLIGAPVVLLVRVLIEIGGRL
jgi:hypothetical protein